MQALTGGPRAGLTAAEVAESLEFNYSPKVRWKLEISTNGGSTWALTDLNILPGGDVTWGYRVPFDVTRPPTDTATVRRTASIEIEGDIGNLDLTNARYRPYMEILSPTGKWVRWNLGVFVTTLPSTDDDGLTIKRQLDLADKTHIYAKEELTEPIVVPYLRNVLLEVRGDMETRFGETTFAFPAGAEVVQDDLVFEPGTKVLEYYNKTLEAGGYEPLFVNEEGQPATRKADWLVSAAIEHTYQPGTTMVTAGRIQPILPEIPNQLIVVAARGPSLAEEGNGIRTITNLTYGPASYTERGYYVPHRVEVEASNQAELDAFAIELAMKFFAGGGEVYRGQVALNPRHSDRDVVGLVKPRLGIETAATKWVVTSWSLPFGSIVSPADVLMEIEMERLVVPEFSA